MRSRGSTLLSGCDGSASSEQTNLLAGRLGPLKVEPDDVDQRDHERRRGPVGSPARLIEAEQGLCGAPSIPAHCEASPGLCAVDSGCVWNLQFRPTRTRPMSSLRRRSSTRTPSWFATTGAPVFVTPTTPTRAGPSRQQPFQVPVAAEGNVEKSILAVVLFWRANSMPPPAVQPTSLPRRSRIRAGVDGTTAPPAVSASSDT